MDETVTNSVVSVCSVLFSVMSGRSLEPYTREPSLMEGPSVTFRGSGAWGDRGPWQRTLISDCLPIVVHLPRAKIR
jgi:hypothetical protein